MALGHFTSSEPLPDYAYHRRQAAQGRERNRCNRAGQALRQAAVGLSTSKLALGAYFRRMTGRLSKAVAVKAVAHKLPPSSTRPSPRAWCMWTGAWLLRKEPYRVRALKHLAKRAAVLGYSLSPTLQAAK
jgi:transposase